LNTFDNLSIFVTDQTSDDAFKIPPSFFDNLLNLIRQKNSQIKNRTINNNKIEVIVPLYIDLTLPDFTEYLNYFAEYKDITFAVILNPNNGPGNSVNNDYLQAINTLKNLQNVIIFGYVYTNYANRDTTDVETEITN